MKKFLIIIKNQNNFKIPFLVKAQNKAEAFKIAAEYFIKEGYFPEAVEILDLFNDIEKIN